MTSDNQPTPGQQADGQPVDDDAPGGGGRGPSSEPSMAELLQAMQAQQAATTRGFADLTSGLGQFLEKMAAVSGPATQPPATQSPAEVAPNTGQPSAPADAAAPAETQPAEPQPADPPNQSPQAQPVTSPPVDAAAYGQTIPAAGFPQAANQAAPQVVPQSVPQAGFPAPEQAQPVPPAGFPVMQDPQAPVAQAPVAQAPVAQARVAQTPIAQTPVAPAAPVATPVAQPVQPARSGFRRKRGAPAQVGPPPAEPPPQQPAADARWKQILFGSDIANNQALEVLRNKVMEGLLGGDRNATGLAGTLLIFKSATADRMPQILKDVGEAYYRWNPRSCQGEDPLRTALITWLHAKCESSGVSNTIVVVQPGDRFEAARHNSKQRGVEVTQIGGWVVLRDNGKVYTKANVEVR